MERKIGKPSAEGARHTGPCEAEHRRRRTKRERELADLARRRHGVVARRQLLAAGLGSSAIQGRLASGRLHAVHRGVYAWGPARLTLRGRWMAAVLACGDAAVLSHRSAAALWGIALPHRGPVEVTVSAGCRRGSGIRSHRSPLPTEDRHLIDGIPVTCLARTLLDLAGVVDQRRLAGAFEEADRLGLMRLPELQRVCDSGGFTYHGHRAAFERDRARDAALQARVPPSSRTERHRQRGQASVEWVALLLIVALLLSAMVAAGVRVPGAELARAVASRLLCAAALAQRCGDEPALIAAYGSDVGRLVREQMPSIAFERGSRAMPVDFRRCRSSSCGDGSARGLVDRTDAELPVTAFVRVIDCRAGAVEQTIAAGADCSGSRSGSLYIQYWMYYADSATLRGVPVAGSAGYHRDDWESAQIRIGPDGEIEMRASSHHGYNHTRSAANWGSDAGVGPLRDAAEALGARPRNGWGPAGGLLLVSGGSHAGNAGGFPRIDRLVPGGRVHLVPLEPIAAAEAGEHRFAVSPPWRKRAWRDPEAEGTD